MKKEGTVFIIDDDPAILESLKWLISSEGWPVETFLSAQAFLQGYNNNLSGCLLLDIRMPGISGLELQECLKARSIYIPIIFMTGHGDVPMAVRAMRLGATDFLVKPFQDQAIINAIRTAINEDREKRDIKMQIQSISQDLETLTPREYEVMQHVINGKPNKTIAIDLGIGSKTIEIHRARIMRKMHARSLAELVKKLMLYKYKRDN